MNLVKALIALVVFAIVAAIGKVVCTHFGIDPFWGWLVGVIAGLAYYFGYDQHRNTPLVP